MLKVKSKYVGKGILVTINDPDRRNRALNCNIYLDIATQSELAFLLKKNLPFVTEVKIKKQKEGE